MQFLSRMRGMMGEQPLPGARGTEAAPALTEAGLRELVADPRYWRDKDPAVLKQVEEGFRSLHPGTTPTASLGRS